MKTSVHAALCLFVGLTAACSSPDDPGVSPPTAGEQHALADAKAMIPTEEAAPDPQPKETETP